MRLDLVGVVRRLSPAILPRMAGRLDGAVVLLTGATGGIGSELAARFAEAGARLVLVGRDRTALEALAASSSRSPEVRLVVADLTRRDAAPRVYDEAVAAWGRVDVVVNNAGAGYFALSDEVEPELTRSLFELNALVPWDLARACARTMREGGGGLIVNVVSCSGRVPAPTAAVYGGSKSALAIMANTMRLELEGTGVRVLNVYPGTVDTRFESNAFREGVRPGVCVGGGCGRPAREVADRIVAATVAGRGGELWMDRRGRLLAAAAILWPGLVDRVLRRVRDWALARPTDHRPPEERRWRLWQVESSLACNLGCVMCPWTEERCRAGDRALMSDEVWAAIQPHLDQIASVDFTGGGEPLLNPRLFDRIADAHRAGCRTGFLTNGMRLDQEACDRLVAAGADWVAVSVDGASREVYERYRPGADFGVVCGNVRRLAELRDGGRPRLILNFVMMPDNVDQLEEMVRLVAELGVEVLNLKQADVVRGEHGAGFALFAGRAERAVRQLEKRVRRAVRLGRKLGVDVRAARFVPEEEPVCEQDPRDSLFVRYDGTMAPCINLAIGGPTTFLGRPVVMPTVRYGRLPSDDPDEVWERSPCTRYRTRFEERERAYGATLAELDIAPRMSALRETLAEARAAMPEPPEGCRTCHYLYGL